MSFASMPRVVFSVGVAALIGSLAVPARANTTLDSGTTTVSTVTDFGVTLYVGTTSTATLEVIAGGYATNSSGYLGYNAGGVGTATVSSGTWANSGDLNVGISGTGTLSVNGGLVTNSSGYLGYSAGGVGMATVSSGTWATRGGLLVGYSGTGTLNASATLPSRAARGRIAKTSTSGSAISVPLLEHSP